MSLDIDGLLEWSHADTPKGVEEALRAVPEPQIGGHQHFHRIGGPIRCQRRTKDLGETGILGSRAAKAELVIFLTLLVDAQDSDVRDVMVPTGIDAAADLDLQLADILGGVEISKAPGDILGNRNRPRVGKGAIVQTGTGYDI